MVRIDCLIFGYRRITVAPEKLSAVTSKLLGAGIPTRIAADGTLILRERDVERARTYLLASCKFEISETLGLYGAYKRMRHKPALLSAIILSAVLMLLSSGLVWDIRVSGNDSVPSSEIVFGLSECGFNVGDAWLATDTAKIETEFLLNSKNVAWINVNRRGCVAYVTVIEKDAKATEEKNDESGYTNIVAAENCVIEEITVSRGIAAVKVGDVVKRGDLLISGIVPSDSGGEFCNAEGVVIGRMSDTVSVNVSRIHEVKSPKKQKIARIDINIFNFSINIFKLYGNSAEEYDIIEDEKVFSLFGKCKLPLSLSVKRLTEYETASETYTDTQLVSVAKTRLNSLTHSRLALADLVKIKTRGKYTHDGYEMSSDIVFSADVGREVRFFVE